MNWYYRKKSGRSVTSQALRFFAVILSVVGGLVPVLVSVFGSRPRWHGLDAFANLRLGQLGYLFLAVAGGLFLLDKYFGYSSGWMRYIVAMQAIEKAREAFRLDWAALSRKLSTAAAGTPEQTETVERMIGRVRSVILEVKEQTEKETQMWLQEFQTNLAQFEKDLKAQMEAGRPGGIDVEVTDGDDLTDIPGVSAATAQVILTEIGTDVSRFRHASAFASWLASARRNESAAARCCPVKHAR